MKNINSFPRYKIDEKGNVFSFVMGRGKKARISEIPQRTLKHILDSTGYFVVTLTNEKGKSNKSIHRLLAEAFIPNPLGLPHVNHKDGNKQNNDIDNLEWVSILENTQHAIRIGLTNPKTRHPDIQEIVQMDLVGNIISIHQSLHSAGRDTGIAWQNISKVCRGLRKSAGNFKWAYK